MGKDLKGKELGTGISQRPDGKYYARMKVGGKTLGKYFDKLAEAKKWRTETEYKRDFQSLKAESSMTFDTWFNYWVNNIKTIKETTYNNITNWYKNYVKETLGDMKLNEIKPLHCLSLLKDLVEKGYSDGTIDKVRFMLHDCFGSALENDYIWKNPITKSVTQRGHGKEAKDQYILSKEERVEFVKTIKNNPYYAAFTLVLETGLRYGELVGLKWTDIDLKRGCVYVERNITYSYKNKKYVCGTPKTKQGYRTIPLSNLAVEALKEQRKNKFKWKVNDEFAEYLFTGKKGTLISKTVLNENLMKISEKMGLPSFSIHTLRHVFATRCIEDGMQPKTLQKILGHANIETTMNLYVHTTQEHIFEEFKKVKEIAV